MTCTVAVPLLSTSNSSSRSIKFRGWGCGLESESARQVAENHNLAILYKDTCLLWFTQFIVVVSLCFVDILLYLLTE